MVQQASSGRGENTAQQSFNFHADQCYMGPRDSARGLGSALHYYSAGPTKQRDLKT